MTAKARITELRTKAGLTQMQLATAIGVDPSTIRNLEKGRAGIEQIERRRLGLQLVRRLAGFPGVHDRLQRRAGLLGRSRHRQRLIGRTAGQDQNEQW